MKWLGIIPIVVFGIIYIVFKALPITSDQNINGVAVGGSLLGLVIWGAYQISKYFKSRKK